MEIKEKKTVDMLTSESVSILTQTFVEIDGVPTQVGQNHRCAYVNSDSGRKSIVESEPEEVAAAVMAIWGDTPTVTETVEIPKEVSTDAE